MPYTPEEIVIEDHIPNDEFEAISYSDNDRIRIFARILEIDDLELQFSALEILLTVGFPNEMILDQFENNIDGMESEDRRMVNSSFAAINQLFINKLSESQLSGNINEKEATLYLGIFENIHRLQSSESQSSIFQILLDNGFIHLELNDELNFDVRLKNAFLNDPDLWVKSIAKIFSISDIELKNIALGILLRGVFPSEDLVQQYENDELKGEDKVEHVSIYRAISDLFRDQLIIHLTNGSITGEAANYYLDIFKHVCYQQNSDTIETAVKIYDEISKTDLSK